MKSVVQFKSICLLLIFSMVPLMSGQAWAQTPPLETDQAKLIKTLAESTNWPVKAEQSKFIIGVFGDSDKHRSFAQYYTDKKIKEKTIDVRLIKTIKEAKNVNLVFLPSNQQRLLTLVNKKVKGENVLVITESNNELYNISYEKSASDLVFKADEASFIDTKLTIDELNVILNAKGLDTNKTAPAKESVAVKVTPPQESVKILQQEKLLKVQSEKLSNYEEKLKKQTSSVSKLLKKLEASEATSKKYRAGFEKESQRLKVAYRVNSKNIEEIELNKKELQRLEEELNEKDSQLQMSKEDWQLSNEEQAKKQQSLIDELTKSLDEQKTLTNNTSIKLSNVSKENDSAQIFITLFYLFIFITVAALVAAFTLWKKTKTLALQPSSGANNSDPILALRERQLIKSESVSAIGYLATDTTFAVGSFLDDYLEQLQSAGDSNNIAKIKPVVSLLENFNTIAADQDEVEPQEFEVIDYVNKMMMLFDFEFSQTGINYDYSGEKTLLVKSVPSYIALILLNLTNNALKHGFDNNGNGKISLKIEKVAKGGMQLVFTDNGRGMSKATFFELFKPFFTTRSDRGYVGVGMSTTHDLVKNKLGGDIKVDSAVGKGTSVTISLP